ncbi:MAG: Fe-S cluster assembly protein SufD [Tepidisphaeraceae bacterium]
MTQLVENKQVHLSHYRSFSGKAFSVAGAFVKTLRQSGIEKFEATGFPNARQEDWRFTNFDPIARTPFVLADFSDSPATSQVAAQYAFGADAAAEIVLVNGHFDPRLSRLSRLPRGAVVVSLADAIESHTDLVEAALGKHAAIDRNPFIALNTGFLRDGAFIFVPRGAVVEKPIHVLVISTAGDVAAVSHPRVLVVAEANSEMSLVESYVGCSAGVSWTNAVTEIVVGEDARVDHCKLQQESQRAFHVAATHVKLAARSNFVSHSATLGAQLTRNDLSVVMAGPRAEATLNGLVVIGGRQHADNHTLLDHAEPNCPSHELYKHVLSDQASGVFKGKILVRQPAQKTDSKQTSKSLLLSDLASMNSQPSLEIYADDVKCTHGSTTGPVDEEMVFYLRSRGVGLEAARHLLTYAFAADITRRIRVAAVRQRLEDFLAAQHGLPRDLRITDLGDHNERAR